MAPFKISVNKELLSRLAPSGIFWPFSEWPDDSQPLFLVVLGHASLQMTLPIELFASFGSILALATSCWALHRLLHHYHPIYLLFQALPAFLPLVCGAEGGLHDLMELLERCWEAH